MERRIRLQSCMMYSPKYILFRALSFGSAQFDIELFCSFHKMIQHRAAIFSFKGAFTTVGSKTLTIF